MKGLNFFHFNFWKNQALNVIGGCVWNDPVNLCYMWVDEKFVWSVCVRVLHMNIKDCVLCRLWMYCNSHVNFDTTFTRFTGCQSKIILWDRMALSHHACLSYLYLLASLVCISHFAMNQMGEIRQMHLFLLWPHCLEFISSLSS